MPLHTHTHTHTHTHAHTHTHTHIHTHTRTHVQHAHMHTHTVLLYKHHVLHTYIDHFTNGATIHVLFELLAKDLAKRLESLFLRSTTPSDRSVRRYAKNATNDICS